MELISLKRFCEDGQAGRRAGLPAGTAHDAFTTEKPRRLIRGKLTRPPIRAFVSNENLNAPENISEK